MLRKILSVVTGLIASGIVVGIVEMVGEAVFPPAEGYDPQNPDLSLVPTMAMVMIGIAWLVGPAVGGFVATRLGRAFTPVLALIVGGLFLAADVTMLVMISSPVWLWIVGIVAPVLGAYVGFLGGRADHPEATED